MGLGRRMGAGRGCWGGADPPFLGGVGRFVEPAFGDLGPCFDVFMRIPWDMVSGRLPIITHSQVSESPQERIFSVAWGENATCIEDRQASADP